MTFNISFLNFLKIALNDITPLERQFQSEAENENKWERETDSLAILIETLKSYFMRRHIWLTTTDVLWQKYWLYLLI